MDTYNWITPALFGNGDHDSMLAIQNFLAQNPPGGAGNGAAGKGGDGKQRLTSLGNLSPPEVSPSPPSSNGHSPVDTQAQRGGAREDVVPAGLVHKRKSLDVGAAPSPANKTRKASGSNGTQKAVEAAEALNAAGKTTDRRKEQNRNAQRAFRERKEKRLTELEDQVADLTEKQEKTANENANLKDLVSRLKAENTRLAAFEQAFTFNVQTNGPSATSSALANMPVSQAFAQTHRSPSTDSDAVPSSSSASDFNAIVRSVQEHLGHAASKSPVNALNRQDSSLSNGRNGASSSSGVSPASANSADSPATAFGGESDAGAGPSRSTSLDAPPPSSTVDLASLFALTQGGTSPQAAPSALETSGATAPSGISGLSSPGAAASSASGQWNPFAYAQDENMSDLTFLNDWDVNTMSFFSDPSAIPNTTQSAPAPPSEGLTLAGMTPTMEFTSLYGVKSPSGTVSQGWGGGWATATWNPDISSSSGQAGGSSSGTSSTPSFGFGSSSASSGSAAKSSDFAGVEDFLRSNDAVMDLSPFSEPTSAAKASPASTKESDNSNAPCPFPSDMKVLFDKGVITEPELDGLCDMLKQKATCQEKTAFLDQVAQHKPSLSPAIDLIRNRRRREMEELLSKGGGTNLQ